MQQRVVAGMEPTLVRNLSDHRGNNLLHVLAGAGNADALAWLCSSFGPEMQDALLDENKRGLTPVVAAIQAGRLEALQFLVDHTSARERLAPVDGDRSLLHIAAKYGKVRLCHFSIHYFLLLFQLEGEREREREREKCSSQSPDNIDRQKTFLPVESHIDRRLTPLMC